MTKTKHLQFSRHFNRKIYSRFAFLPEYVPTLMLFQICMTSFFFLLQITKSWTVASKHQIIPIIFIASSFEFHRIKKVIHVCNNTRLRKWQNFHFWLDWHINCHWFHAFVSHSHITLQPKTGCPLKLSRVEPGQYLDGRPPGKTRLLLEEVLVRPAGGAHPVVCVGPNAPV